MQLVGMEPTAMVPPGERSPNTPIATGFGQLICDTRQMKEYLGCP